MSTITPMILRSLGSRSVEVHAPTVIDVNPLVAKMYCLHLAPALSEEQHERNIWNPPYRPGPWLEPWCSISAPRRGWPPSPGWCGTHAA